MKVLAADGISPKGIELLQKEFEVVVKDKLPAEELLEIIPQFDAIMVRSASKVTKEVIDRATNLKIIGRAGVGIDGIDIDWEYPTVAAAGISASPDDTRNFTLLMRDLRKALGNDRLLTLATPASARHFDFASFLQYVDFVNIMAYDMAVVPNHHAAMHSADTTMMTVERAVDAHLQAGVPADRLVLGMPFYGKGTLKKPRESSIEKVKADSVLTEQWNDEGQYALLTDSLGTVVYTFDNARSLAVKCQYALERGLRGAMYWEASCDDANHTFARTVWNEIMGDNR